MCPILNSHMQVDLIAFMSLNGLMDDNGTQEDIAPKKHSEWCLHRKPAKNQEGGFTTRVKPERPYNFSRSHVAKPNPKSKQEDFFR